MNELHKDLNQVKDKLLNEVKHHCHIYSNRATNDTARSNAMNLIINKLDAIKTIEQYTTPKFLTK